MINTIFLGILTTVQAGEINVTAKGHANNPVWSADGTKLAFEINAQAGDISIYVANVENAQSSGAPQAISLNVGGSSFGGSGGVVTAAPVWHPQGMLFFEGSHKGGSNRIYVHSFTGAPPRQAVSEAQISGDLSWPAISIDGGELVFVSDSTGKGDIYTFNLRNWKDVIAVTATEFSEMAPRFNGEGEIIYTRKRKEGEDVFLYNGGSSDWVGGDGDQTRTNWAGSSVVFFSSERGGDLWDVVVSIAPKQKKTLAKNIRLPFRATPAVSPDGQWVAYGVEDTERSGSIWVTKIDGSKSVAIKTKHKACGEPAFTEIEGRIYLAYTALPKEGSDWRQLHVVDVTSQLQ